MDPVAGVVVLGVDPRLPGFLAAAERGDLPVPVVAPHDHREQVAPQPRRRRAGLLDEPFVERLGDVGERGDLPFAAGLARLAGERRERALGTRHHLPPGGFDERPVEAVETDLAGEVVDVRLTPPHHPDQAVEQVAQALAAARSRGHPFEQREHRRHVTALPLLGAGDPEERLLELGCRIEAGDAVMGQRPAQAGEERLGQPGAAAAEVAQIGEERLLDAARRGLVALLVVLAAAEEGGEVGEDREPALDQTLGARSGIGGGEQPRDRLRSGVVAEEEAAELLEIAAGAGIRRVGERLQRDGGGGRELLAGGASERFEHQQRRADRHGLVGVDEELAHPSVRLRVDRRLELHRLEDDQRGAGSNLRAGTDREADDQRRGRRAHELPFAAHHAVRHAVGEDGADVSLGQGVDLEAAHPGFEADAAVGAVVESGGDAQVAALEAPFVVAEPLDVEEVRAAAVAQLDPARELLGNLRPAARRGGEEPFPGRGELARVGGDGGVDERRLVAVAGEQVAVAGEGRDRAAGEAFDLPAAEEARDEPLVGAAAGDEHHRTAHRAMETGDRLRPVPPPGREERDRPAAGRGQRLPLAGESRGAQAGTGGEAEDRHPAGRGRETVLRVERGDGGGERMAAHRGEERRGRGAGGELVREAFEIETGGRFERRGGQCPAGAPARGAGRHLPGGEGERDLPEADRQLVVAGRLLGAKDRDPEQARRDPRRGRLGEHEAGVEPFGEIDETEDPGPVLIDGDGRAEAAGGSGLAHWVLLIAANGARSSGATGCGRSTVR
ncbi:MAG: hypothetical protein BWX64_02056 [Acidobacteria bacterium ADurb.Bin051]|nr:MAG: hypothetical protein BWX64_02056 [Acidobacteria bacterium ADurb.Bin051]